jgi:hypothetical protein
MYFIRGLNVVNTNSLNVKPISSPYKQAFQNQNILTIINCNIIR